MQKSETKPKRVSENQINIQDKRKNVTELYKRISLKSKNLAVSKILLENHHHHHKLQMHICAFNLSQPSFMPGLSVCYGEKAVAKVEHVGPPFIGMYKHWLALLHKQISLEKSFLQLSLPIANKST